MRAVRLALLSAIVGAVSALTYYALESIVALSIEHVWIEMFDTQSNTLAVLLLTIAAGVLYFGVQQGLDKKARRQTEHSLFDLPSPSVRQFTIILFVGFLSLFAGASLGPEAVLFPACAMIGLITAKHTAASKQDTTLLVVAGLTALMASFFNSWLVGVLSLLLIAKETKSSITTDAISVAIVASLSAYATLFAIEGSSYFDGPKYDTAIQMVDIIYAPVLFALGILLIHLIERLLKLFTRLTTVLRSASWWQHAMVASIVLALIYIFGGEYVRFTGNESILPMLENTSEIGFLGLLSIALFKILAICWSKTSGYRGGMVLPVVLIATSLVASVHYYQDTLNVFIGVMVVMAGVLYANAKRKVMF